MNIRLKPVWIALALATSAAQAANAVHLREFEFQST